MESSNWYCPVTAITRLYGSVGVLSLGTHLKTTQPEPVGGAVHIVCTSVLASEGSASRTVFTHSSLKAVSESPNSWKRPARCGDQGSLRPRLLEPLLAELLLPVASTVSMNRKNVCRRAWVRAPSRDTGDIIRMI